MPESDLPARLERLVSGAVAPAEIGQIGGGKHKPVAWPLTWVYRSPAPNPASSPC